MYPSFTTECHATAKPAYIDSRTFRGRHYKIERLSWSQTGVFLLHVVSCHAGLNRAVSHHRGVPCRAVLCPTSTPRRGRPSPCDGARPAGRSGRSAAPAWHTEVNDSPARPLAAHSPVERIPDLLSACCPVLVVAPRRSHGHRTSPAPAARVPRRRPPFSHAALTTRKCSAAAPARDSAAAAGRRAARPPATSPKTRSVTSQRRRRRRSVGDRRRPARPAPRGASRLERRDAGHWRTPGSLPSPPC